MRLLSIFCVCLTILLLFTSACIKSIAKKKFTGVNLEHTCFGSLHASKTLRKWNWNYTTYEQAYQACVNDVLLVVYEHPDYRIENAFLNRFIENFLSNTNNEIGKMNMDCSVTPQIAQSLTNYFFVKTLKKMSYENEIKLVDDTLLLGDLVCRNGFDNTDTLSHHFGNYVFRLLIFSEHLNVRNSTLEVKYVLRKSNVKQRY